MDSADVVTYRPSANRVVAIGIAVVAALAIGSGLLSNPAAILPYLAPIALTVVLGWAVFWKPAVIITPAGVELQNVTRTVELPWLAIQGIDTKYALTLQTAYGIYSAWAAPAGGRRSGTNASTSAAGLVQQRWDELREAGFLANPQLERDRPVVRWHTATLVAIAALAALSVLSLVL